MSPCSRDWPMSAHLCCRQPNAPDLEPGLGPACFSSLDFSYSIRAIGSRWVGPEGVALIWLRRVPHPLGATGVVL
jgi:hypothetical protein